MIGEHLITGNAIRDQGSYRWSVSFEQLVQKLDHFT